MLSGRSSIYLAVLLWSSSGAFGKSLSLAGPTMAFYRAVFATFFLFFFPSSSKL